MKKKVALLLAFVMMLSLLPMSVFGSTAAYGDRRPGAITPRVVPHGNFERYTIAIDSSWLSQVPAVVPGTTQERRLFIEFEISAGGGTGIGAAMGGTDGFSVAPGSGFRFTSPAAVNPITVTDLSRLGTALAGDGRVNPVTGLPFTDQVRQLAGYRPDWRPGNQYTFLRIPLDTLMERNRVFAGYVPGVTPNTAITPQMLFNAGLLQEHMPGLTQADLDAANWNALPGVYAPEMNLRRAINLAAATLTGRSIDDVWAGGQGHLSNTIGGTANGQLRHWRAYDREFYADWDTGAFVRSYTYVDAVSAMEGWINFHLPIRADSPNMTITARLRFEVIATGAQGTIATLAHGYLVGGWAGGISISSRGVVPMTGYAVLNAIRLTEDAPGRLVALNNNRDANNNLHTGTFNTYAEDGTATVRHGVMTHIVQLVAPRGFRWDTGLMFGAAGGGGIVSTSGSLSPTQFRVLNPIAGSTAQSWLNPITDLHEIFIEVQTAARGTALGVASTRAYVDIAGLALVPVSGAPTTGDVAIDVTVGSWVRNIVNPLNPTQDVVVGYGDTQGNGVFVQGSIAGDQQGMIARNIYEVWIRRETAAGAPAEWTTSLHFPALVTPPSGITAEAGRYVYRNTYGAIVAPGSASGSRTVTGILMERGEFVQGGQVIQPRFGQQQPDSWRAPNWRHIGLVVANLDFIGGLEVIPPANVQTRVSGRVTAGFGATGNDRFINGGYHTIRIYENLPGALFDVAQPARYELRVAQEGVNFVDARARIGHAGNASQVTGWTSVESNTHFVGALTEFEGNILRFAPRSVAPDAGGARRHMDLGLMLSVEAGFAAANPDAQVDIEVFRNGIYIGTATVLFITDPIEVEEHDFVSIYREQLDVLSLTPASGFTVRETAAGNLRNNDQLWFHIEAVQADLGRRVVIPGATMGLFLGAADVNTAESNMTIQELTTVAPAGAPDDVVRIRIVRPSVNVPGEISFNNPMIAGTAVPGLEWHVVVSGPEITPNDRHFLNYASVHGIANWTVFHERAVFHTMAYSAMIMYVAGEPSIDPEEGVAPPTPPAPPAPPEPPAPPAPPAFVSPTRIWNQTMVDSTGAPLVYSRDGRWFAQAREFVDVFLDPAYSNVSWIRPTVTLSGRHVVSGEMIYVNLELNSPNARINGVTTDIETFMGSPDRRGQTVALTVDGRTMLPLRFLGDVFGVEVEWLGGGQVRFN